MAIGGLHSPKRPFAAQAHLDQLMPLLLYSPRWPRRRFYSSPSRPSELRPLLTVHWVISDPKKSLGRGKRLAIPPCDVISLDQQQRRRLCLCHLFWSGAKSSGAHCSAFDCSYSLRSLWPPSYNSIGHWTWRHIKVSQGNGAFARNPIRKLYMDDVFARWVSSGVNPYDGARETSS